MKTQNITTELFPNIKEVYNYIDDISFDVDHTHDILDVWVKYRDITFNEDEKQNAQREVECNMFYFAADKVFSFSYSYSTESNIETVTKYPDLDQFQKDGFEYLLERAKTSTSAIIKARYYHLLWKGVAKKNREYARLAIDYYIESIQVFYDRFLSKNIYKNDTRINRLFEHIVALANETNQSIDAVKNIAKFLLFKAENIEFYIKHGIIQNMVEYSKLFKPIDFENILNLFDLELLESRASNDEFILATIYLPTAIKVAQKINAQVSKWYNEIAFAHLRSVKDEEDEDRQWMKLSKYATIISYFRLAGNLEKKKEIERLYSELKAKVKLQSFAIEFNEEQQEALRKTLEVIKDNSKNVLKSHPFNVYHFISNGNFFPSKHEVIEATKNNENAFLNFVTTIFFDQNKNVSTKDENDLKEVYNTYAFRLKILVLPFLHYILVIGIQSGHLTAKNFISFLKENTWIGKDYIKYDLGGDPERINFIGILAPAIIEYFNQVQAWGVSKYYRPNFVLCIDSLTIKIEGLFRNFCERLNIPTSVGKKKGMQEALINNLLENDIIKQYFDDEDLFLFNYLFSGDVGLNLRNNIAHCFYHEQDYNPEFMLLLIAVLLRIGKYNINEETDDN